MLPENWSGVLSRRLYVLFIELFPWKIMFYKQFYFFPQTLAIPSTVARSYKQVFNFLIVLYPSVLLVNFFVSVLFCWAFFKGLNSYCIAAWSVASLFSEPSANLVSTLREEYEKNITYCFYQEDDWTTKLFNAPIHFCKKLRRDNLLEVPLESNYQLLGIICLIIIFMKESRRKKATL